MALHRRYWWVVLLVVAAALDLVGRLVLSFDITRVIAFESILFLSVCVLVALITVRYRPISVTIGRIERALSIVFGLAGVRVALWAAGAGVELANLVTLGVGVALVIVFAACKRYVARRGMAR